jgi:hypothetical protein
MDLVAGAKILHERLGQTPPAPPEAPPVKRDPAEAAPTIRARIAGRVRLRRKSSAE